MIDLTNCKMWLEAHNFKKVCVQITDDHLSYSKTVIQQLQSNRDTSVYVIGNTIYESCCADKLSIDHIKPDAFLHVGHACLSSVLNLPTYHIFSKQKFDLNLFCKEFLDYFTDYEEKIVMFYDVTFADIIDDVSCTLKKKYKNFTTSYFNCTTNFKTQETISNNFSILSRINLPNCDNFHNYKGVYLGLNKKTLISLTLSISLKEWHYFENDTFLIFDILHLPWLKKRHFLKEKIRDANMFGLVISSLNIEEHLKITSYLKEILKKNNKKVYVFNISKINPSKLANFQEIDIFVLISCPESTLIETSDYLKPIVTPFDIELSFNPTRMSVVPYAIDYKDMLPGGIYFSPLKVTNEADVSLASGKIRYSAQQRDIDNGKSKICPKNEKSSLFLKSWNGLVVTSEKFDLSAVDSGRDGLPTKYVNEISH